MSIAIAINVCKEPEAQVEDCLVSIVDNIPKVQIRVFLDGVDRPEIKSLCGCLNVSVKQRNVPCGNNLLWHKWWMDMLYFLWESKAEVCFKLDPDSRVTKPIKEFPQADYFGSIETAFMVQGGVTGLSRKSVKCLLDLLTQTNANDPIFSHMNGNHKIFIDDQKIGRCMEKLGFGAVAWPECLSRWRQEITEEECRTYSMVHPVYAK